MAIGRSFSYEKYIYLMFWLIKKIYNILSNNNKYVLINDFILNYPVSL